MLNKLLKSFSINSLVSVYDLLFTHPILRKNIELKDKYKNKRIFILGSGSSILLYDLKILRNEYVMTQNSFHMHIDPNYHCVIPYYQSDKEFSIWINYIAEMKELMPNSLFIWGLNTRSLIEKHHKDIYDKSYYVNSKYNLLTLNKAKLNISKTKMNIPTVLTQ